MEEPQQYDVTEFDSLLLDGVPEEVRTADYALITADQVDDLAIFPDESTTKWGSNPHT